MGNQVSTVVFGLSDIILVNIPVSTMPTIKANEYIAEIKSSFEKAFPDVQKFLFLPNRGSGKVNITVLANTH